VFSKAVLDDLYLIFSSPDSMPNARRNWWEWTEMTTYTFLINYPPGAVSVNSLKGVARHLFRRTKYPEAVAALPSRSFANTSNSRMPCIDMDRVESRLSMHNPKGGSAVRDFFPVLNGNVCRASDQYSSGFPASRS